MSKEIEVFKTGQHTVGFEYKSGFIAAGTTVQSQTLFDGSFNDSPTKIYEAHIFAAQGAGGGTIDTSLTRFVLIRGGGTETFTLATLTTQKVFRMTDKDTLSFEAKTSTGARNVNFEVYLKELP